MPLMYEAKALGSRDYLPSVGEPGRGLVAQASKGTAAEGGGLFASLPPLESKLSALVRTQKRHPVGCLSCL